MLSDRTLTTWLHGLASAEERLVTVVGKSLVGVKRLSAQETTMRVFVFGNGLSVAPTDGRLNVADITEKLWEWLDEGDPKEFVEDLQEWAKPQMPGLDPEAHNYNFELVAGSLHRLGRAVASLTSLADLGLDAADGLLQASAELTGLYRRVVAYVLLQIDNAAHDRDAKVGLVEWDGLNAMAEALCELQSTETVAIYTLNYDSFAHVGTARADPVCLRRIPQLGVQRPARPVEEHRHVSAARQHRHLHRSDRRAGQAHPG